MAALDFPSSPTNGQLYPAAPNAQYIYNSTAGGPSTGAWESLPMQSAKTVTDDVAPLNPADGDQWFSTVDGVLYIYVVDVDGGQWVESRSAIISDGYYSPNYIINGGMDIWQRGTSFTNPGFVYTSDRWVAGRGAFDTGMSVTQQTGTADIRYCARVQRVSGNTSTNNLRFGTTFESATSIPLAGKTVTLSFYARKGANFSNPSSSVDVYLRSGTTIDAGNITAGDNFGSGAASVIGATATLTTSWQRFSFTGSVSSTATQLGLGFVTSVAGTAGANDYFEVTGVQLEEGSVATPFRRNANSLQGELAACQRYYVRYAAEAVDTQVAGGVIFNATGSYFQIPVPAEMRIKPTAIEYSNVSDFRVYRNGGNVTPTSVSLYSGGSTKKIIAVYMAIPTSTAGNSCWVEMPTVNSYLAFSSEL